MTSSLVRKQVPRPAGRQLVADTGAISVSLVPIALPPVAVPARPGLGDAVAATKRFLAGLLGDARQPRIPAPTPAQQLRYDAVYRDDEGGAGDDGGWA